MSAPRGRASRYRSVLLTVLLLAAAVPRVLATPGEAGDPKPPIAAAADPGRPQPPLRVMTPSEDVARRLIPPGRSLADVIGAMDPRAARTPGPRMELPGITPATSGASRVLGPTTFRTLAILVDFSDRTATVGASFFDTLVFGTTGTETVNRYFDEASYGLLDIVTLNLPSAMSWQRAPQTLAYYVGGDYCTDAPYPNNCQKLTEDVTALVDPIVDFSQYDNDGDGWVDTVFIIHSGTGAEISGNATDIWSHSWATKTYPLYDGVRVGSYTTEPEYWLSGGDMTHGVYAHELSHAFGLPDLYDYDRTSEGVGDWSLMAGGSWNGTLGDTPAHLDAWSRVYLGFNDVVEIAGPSQAISLPRVIDNQVGSIYRLDGANSAEYWLLENRQKVGSDSTLPGAGLLIWHVDEYAYDNDTECRFVDNFVCTGYVNHFRVALEQADAGYDLEIAEDEGDTGDPYPGAANNRSFGFGTNPNTSSYYTDSDLGVSVTAISDSSSTMTATVADSGAVTRPANDAFADGTALGPLPDTVNQSTLNATLEPGEPAPSCGYLVGASVWFDYTAPSGGAITVDTSGSDFDTVVAVWTGSAVGTLTPVACDDDDGVGLTSLVEFQPNAGTTYRIQVGGYRAAAGDLQLVATQVPAPANDDFAAATAIASLPAEITQGTSGATIEVGEPGPGCISSMGATVWFAVTPDATSAIAVDTGGSGFDTVVAVWTGASLVTLASVACDDDSGLGLTSRVEFAAAAGVTHWIQVGGYNAATGDLAMEVTATPLVVRYAGANRYATAAAISAGDFPDPALVDTVFIATGLNFPDGLAGAAVAAEMGAPLLLVHSGGVPAETAAELTRLGPDTIVILGGAGVISDAVAATLGTYAATVRLSGGDRYATGVAVSQYGFPFGAGVVFVATGTGFADALAAGPAAAEYGAPVLLTQPNSLPPAVAAEVVRLDPWMIVVVGGTGAVSAAVFDALKTAVPGAYVTRVAGGDRYATAVALSQFAFDGADRVYLATGANFPDALAGAAAAGVHRSPVLLVPGASIPVVTQNEITSLGPARGILLGGTGVVGPAVETDLGSLLVN